jgi:hypothetical protein
MKGKLPFHFIMSQAHRLPGIEHVFWIGINFKGMQIRDYLWPKAWKKDQQYNYCADETCAPKIQFGLTAGVFR